MNQGYRRQSIKMQTFYVLDRDVLMSVIDKLMYERHFNVCQRHINIRERQFNVCKIQLMYVRDIYNTQYGDDISMLLVCY